MAYDFEILQQVKGGAMAKLIKIIYYYQISFNN
jgi:hypothetical protein